MAELDVVRIGTDRVPIVGHHFAPGRGVRVGRQGCVNRMVVDTHEAPSLREHSLGELREAGGGFRHVGGTHEYLRDGPVPSDAILKQAHAQVTGVDGLEVERDASVVVVLGMAVPPVPGQRDQVLAHGPRLSVERSLRPPPRSAGRECVRPRAGEPPRRGGLLPRSTAIQSLARPTRFVDHTVSGSRSTMASK